MRGLIQFFWLSMLCFSSAHAAVPPVEYFQNGLDEKEYQTYAILAPFKETQISSEIDAQIKVIYFLPGDHFKQHDVLIEFDCEPFDIQVKRLLAVTRATAAKYKSNQELKKMSSVSDLDLQNSESEDEKANADLALAKLKQGKCKIKAAYDGEVVTKLANEYEMVKVDDPLMEVMSNERPQVQMYIPSEWLPVINIDAVFSLTLKELGPKVAVMGKIIKIVGKVDTASQSVLVFGELMPLLDPSVHLYAGMSGQATFDLKKRSP